MDTNLTLSNLVEDTQEHNVQDLKNLKMDHVKIGTRHVVRENHDMAQEILRENGGGKPCYRYQCTTNETELSVQLYKVEEISAFTSKLDYDKSVIIVAIKETIYYCG